MKGSQQQGTERPTSRRWVLAMQVANLIVGVIRVGIELANGTTHTMR